MKNALKIRNLSKTYPDFTLDHINITLPSGCIMGFVGENGAGKSTTIKLILDLIPRDSGEISVLGTDAISQNKEIKENIGVVMEECSFPDQLTVRDIETIMKCCYQTWNSQTFANYCRRFELPPKKTVKELSRGMKMKLSIAVALSHDSKLLILDEATSGLDPVVRDEILDIFLEFIQDEGHSIFISSHIISDLEKICDYITFIHKGKIVFSETKDNLLDQYVIIKCSEEEYRTIDPTAVIGMRQNRFGIEALAWRQKVPATMVQDAATIEDVMLYYVKGEK